MATIKTKFAVVVLNETRNWEDCEIKRAAEEVWTAYLVDLDRPVNLAELRTSYEMLPLYSVTKERLTDALDEELQIEFSRTQDPIYIHTHIIDRMFPSEHAAEIGEETHPIEDGDDAEVAYAKVEQQRVEYEQGNQRYWSLNVTPNQATIRP